MSDQKKWSALICDDERDLADELGEFFDALGWSVTVCYGGFEANRLLASGLAPDCLLTDLCLGDLDGSRVVASARLLPVPIRPLVLIIITGNILGSATKESLDVDLLYQKPVDPIALAKNIEEILLPLKAQKGENPR